jgi:hypothetical protein
MLFKALSAAVYGIDANIIDVEVDFSGIKTDQDHFHTVGLPDAAVRESRDRVRAAIKNSGFDVPPTHITINLAPADIKKEGSGFDLPMAIGILAPTEHSTSPTSASFSLSANSDSMADFALSLACCPSPSQRTSAESKTSSFPSPMRAKLQSSRE